MRVGTKRSTSKSVCHRHFTRSAAGLLLRWSAPIAAWHGQQREHREKRAVAATTGPEPLDVDSNG